MKKCCGTTGIIEDSDGQIRCNYCKLPIYDYLESDSDAEKA